LVGLIYEKSVFEDPSAGDGRGRASPDLSGLVEKVDFAGNSAFSGRDVDFVGSFGFEKGVGLVGLGCPERGAEDRELSKVFVFRRGGALGD
jgi:hypothetical protein